eukprot:scaffold394232_cov31-Prasinocladus_malaysianus.AAC.1
MHGAHKTSGAPEPGAHGNCDPPGSIRASRKHAIKFCQASSFANLSMHRLGICLWNPTEKQRLCPVILQGVAWGLGCCAMLFQAGHTGSHP